MKCPKCSYISFDHNQVCPKCNRDISAERGRMNLPSFRPSPPSLLGALTGELSDSNVGLRTDEFGEGFRAGETDFSPEDSQTIEAMEEAFQEGDLLEMQIEASPEAGVHFEAEEGAEEASPDLGDLVLDDSELGAPDVAEVPGDEIESLELDDLTGEETEIAFDEDITAIGEDEPSGEEALELDLDIGLDDAAPATEAVEMAADEGQDLEISIELEGDEGVEDDELEFDLDDLSLDETPSEAEEEQQAMTLDTSELITSEIDLRKVSESEGADDFDFEFELEGEDSGDKT